MHKEIIWKRFKGWIAKDAGGSDGALDDDTVRDYLFALRRLMVIYQQYRRFVLISH